MEYELFLELKMFSVPVWAIYLMEENTRDFVIKNISAY